MSSSRAVSPLRLRPREHDCSNRECPSGCTRHQIRGYRTRTPRYLRQQERQVWSRDIAARTRQPLRPRTCRRRRAGRTRPFHRSAECNGQGAEAGAAGAIGRVVCTLTGRRSKNSTLVPPHLSWARCDGACGRSRLGGLGGC